MGLFYDRRFVTIVGGDARQRSLPVAPQIFGNARTAFFIQDELPTVALSAQVLDPRPADLANQFAGRARTLGSGGRFTA